MNKVKLNRKVEIEYNWFWCLSEIKWAELGRFLLIIVWFLHFFASGWIFKVESWRCWACSLSSEIKSLVLLTGAFIGRSTLGQPVIVAVELACTPLFVEASLFLETHIVIILVVLVIVILRLLRRGFCLLFLLLQISFKLIIFAGCAYTTTCCLVVVIVATIVVLVILLSICILLL